ncbi:MAG TPA: hypothetical protein VFA74_15180 [Terriglobales bacterium]|nr:hypothetical protein [Terriglobales bacterium]
MYRRLFVFVFAFACASTLFAQDLSDIQIHGFVTQGFLYSSNNNLFTMNTSDGSARWTDAALSLSDAASDKLRIGVQLHVYQFGELGGANMIIDWATGDYRASDRVRFVVGKVKTVTGLFNDSQDVDTVHLWVLLPESMYPTDNKSFNLAHYGGDFYGAMPLGKRWGTLGYRGFAGYRPLDLNGGYAKLLSPSIGSAFTTGGSNEFGGDLRWETPLKGLLVGVSALTSGLDGTAPTGSFHIPYSTTPVPYAKFEKGKFMAAGEYKRNTSEIDLSFNLPGGGHFIVPSTYDTRSWYAMSSYRLTGKLQAGAYYSHYINGGVNDSLPVNFSKDWTVSGRYDFNGYFYTKVEEHFINGTALDYYTDTNPAGEKPKSKLLAAKVGFNF